MRVFFSFVFVFLLRETFEEMVPRLPQPPLAKQGPSPWPRSLPMAAPVLQALPQPLVLLRRKAIGTKTPGGTPQGLSEVSPCTGSVENQLPCGYRHWMEEEVKVWDRFPVSSRSFLQLHKSTHPVLGLLALLLSWFPKEQPAARALAVQGAGRSLSCGECGCSLQDQC